MKGIGPIGCAMPWICLAILLQVIAEDIQAKDIRDHLELWATEGPTWGIRDFLQKVSFEVASSYASWAADLPNVGQNYAVAAAVLENLGS